MQTLAFFHAKRPVTIPTAQVHHHQRFCPLPSIMEREKKNPPIVQQHCLAIAKSPILGKVLDWNCIQCRIKASSFKAGCSTLGIRSNDSIKILERGRMLFYIIGLSGILLDERKLAKFRHGIKLQVLYCTQKAFSTCPTLEYLICNLAGMINVKITFTTSVRRVSSLLQKHQSLLERLSSHC